MTAHDRLEVEGDAKPRPERSCRQLGTTSQRSSALGWLVKLAVPVAAVCWGVQSLVALGATTQGDARSWPDDQALRTMRSPHLFASPHMSQKLHECCVSGGESTRSWCCERCCASTAKDGAVFLTTDDARELRRLDVQHPRQQASAAAPLRRQPCEIPRIESRLSLADFMSEYHDTPAILGVGTGIGTLPRPITPRMIAELQPGPSSLVHCLCNPQHGSNFEDKFLGTAGTGSLQLLRNHSKRYCLWQLPLFAELFLGDPSPHAARRENPFVPGQPILEEELTAHLALAKALHFQCRVAGSKDGQGLIDGIVNSLGGGSPWWGANLRGANFHSAAAWFSTAGSRTPLHIDTETQFLVQLQGEKHVTLFPNMGPSPHEARHLKELAIARGGALNLTTVGTELAKLNMSLAEEAPNGAQRCVLRPGEVLWMPLGVHHDIFSFDSSLSLSLRFNALDA